MRLNDKQVENIHKERNRIIRFCQKLREMGYDDSIFAAKCHEAANDLMGGCFMLDDVILEGSAEDG